jgi:hypothetical protein
MDWSHLEGPGVSPITFSLAGKNPPHDDDVW